MEYSFYLLREMAVNLIPVETISLNFVTADNIDEVLRNHNGQRFSLCLRQEIHPVVIPLLLQSPSNTEPHVAINPAASFNLPDDFLLDYPRDQTHDSEIEQVPIEYVNDFRFGTQLVIMDSPVDLSIDSMAIVSMEESVDKANHQDVEVISIFSSPRKDDISDYSQEPSESKLTLNEEEKISENDCRLSNQEERDENVEVLLQPVNSTITRLKLKHLREIRLVNRDNLTFLSKFYQDMNRLSAYD
jgi:hypothetical protein